MASREMGMQGQLGALGQKGGIGEISPRMRAGGGIGGGISGGTPNDLQLQMSGQASPVTLVPPSENTPTPFPMGMTAENVPFTDMQQATMQQGAQGMQQQTTPTPMPMGSGYSAGQQMGRGIWAPTPRGNVGPEAWGKMKPGGLPPRPGMPPR